MGLRLSECGYFLIQRILLVKKPCFFENEAAYVCATARKCHKFLFRFYTKTRLSQDLLPEIELLKKLFPKLLDMKNANLHIFFKVVRKIE